MKNLYLIGGPMGVGKTATCQILKQTLNNSVFLDGDWCWDMHPFQVTAETRQMVESNICFLLNSFIHCSVLEHIIFGWVMHEQAIIDNILARLDTANCHVHLISLVCCAQALQARLQTDVAAGIRTADVIPRSLDRLPLYEKLNTYPVDVSVITPGQAADLIIRHCRPKRE